MFVVVVWRCVALFVVSLSALLLVVCGCMLLCVVRWLLVVAWRPLRCLLLCVIVVLVFVVCWLLFAVV